MDDEARQDGAEEPEGTDGPDDASAGDAPFEGAVGEQGADGTATDADGVESEEDEVTEVGDAREKHVRVLTKEGRNRSHGDVYLRHSETSFVVSPDPSFAEEATTRYRKADLLRVEVSQHHSACFLTTAVAGDGPALDDLRRFRDGAMLRTPVGRALVAVYEAVSPPVAATLARHPDSRTAGAVRLFVDRCAALARRREGAGAAGRLGLSLLLTLLYVVGMAVATAGHAAIRATEAAGAPGSPRAD